MSTKCISCKQPVRVRQEGLQCDGCLHWQHRECGTGVCQSDYRDAVKNGTTIDRRCSTCNFAEPIPLAESTPFNFESTVYNPLSVQSVQSVDITSDLPAADPIEYPGLTMASTAEPLDVDSYPRTYLCSSCTEKLELLPYRSALFLRGS